MTDLERSILATVSYYDIFDYPLTGFEIWRLLIRAKQKQTGPDLPRQDRTDTAGLLRQSAWAAGGVFEALHGSGELKERLGEKFGFYCLFGRERIVEKRLRRKKLADRKWKKLRRVFRLLAAVPFVRGIFVSGSLAMENSKEDSDVDIIVVARSGRIWTVRTFMTAFTFLLGVRRHGDKTRDRICLNHYITDKSLLIPFGSLYNAESYAHLLSVYREDDAIFRRFQEENDWLGRYLINYRPSELSSTRAVARPRIFSLFSRLGEFLLSGQAGDKLERVFASFQRRRIEKDPLFKKTGGRITIDETQLEFHPDSHEYFVIPEFNRRMETMGLGEFAGQQDSGLNK